MSLGVACDSQACQLCNPYPKQTAADLLVDSSTVVLARENPDTPFSYRAHETLKGELIDNRIDLFVDSTTRRRLAADPQSVVVLVRGGLEDRGGSEEKWRSLGVVDQEYLRVLRRIALLSPQWTGPAGLQRRHEFFLPLIARSHPQLFELAYLEIARAPYRVIKQASRFVDAAQLRNLFADPSYFEWRGLATLMLAHNGEAADHEYLDRAFRSAERFRLVANLSALAAAYLELQGAEGIGFLEDRYLDNAQRSREEVLEVVKALSVLGGEEDGELRERVVESYATLLQTHPNMAGYVARDLIAWKRWGFAETLRHAGMVGEEIEASDRRLIAEYVRTSALEMD